MSKPTNPLDLLQQMNMSELVLLAQEHDENAHRGLSREDLYQLILNPTEETLPVRTVNKYRLTIMSKVLEHWAQVRPLLVCPAATGSRRACFQCTDLQVVECVSTNKHLFEKKEEIT